MVNYSKWDKLDFDDDDDEDSNKPRIQSFQAPQRVTFGGGGMQVEDAPAAKSQHGDADGDGDGDEDEPMEPASDSDEEGSGVFAEDRREDVLNLRGLAERALHGGDPAEAVRLLEKAMRFGGDHCPGLREVLESARRQASQLPPCGGAVAVAAPSAPSACPEQAAANREQVARSGGEVPGRYRWTQTRDAVEVNVFVPAGTRAKSVTLSVSEASGKVVVDGAVVFEGAWEFKVEPEEDSDWEVRDLADGQRAVRLTLRKKALPGNLSVIVWWSCVLKGDPKIDVQAIDDRKKERAESFAEAWKQAHVMFKERAQNRQPVAIEVPIGPAKPPNYRG